MSERVRLVTAENRGDAGDQAVRVHTDYVEGTALSIRQKVANAGISKSLQIRDKEGHVICFDCRDEISTVRLNVMPHAIRCRDCEERATPDSKKSRLGFRNPARR